MGTAKVSFLLVVSVLSHLLFGKTPVYLLPQNEVVITDKAGNSVQMFVRSEGRNKIFIVRTEGHNVFEEFENQGKIDSFLSKYHYFNHMKEQFFYVNNNEYAELVAKKRGLEAYNVSITVQPKNIFTCGLSTTTALFNTLGAFTSGATFIPGTAKQIKDLYGAITYTDPKPAQTNQSTQFYASEFYKKAYEDQHKPMAKVDKTLFTGAGALVTMIIPGAIGSVITAIQSYPTVRQACGLSMASLELTSKESL